jgi:hypothetical protein
VVVGAFILFTNWNEQRRSENAAREREEREAQFAAEAQREALIAAPPAEGQETGIPRTSRAADRRYEVRFRDLAREYNVEVLEYRPVAPREVVVRLRTRQNQGIPDLLNEALLQDIIYGFDDRMFSQNNQMTVDPMSGARIHETRFTMNLE